MHDPTHGASSYQIGEDLAEVPASATPMGDVEQLVRGALDRRPPARGAAGAVVAYDEQADSTAL